MPRQSVYDMEFNRIYEALVAKAEKHGRTRAEVDQVIKWLTGYVSVDILKGFIGVKLGFLLGGYVVGTLCAVSAFCGHIWPALYSFHGGKGVATAFGVITAVDWKLGLAVLAVVAVFVILTKRMSVGSIMGAVSFPLLAWLMEPGFFVPGFIMAIIVVVKHRANIGRLMRGEEPKMSFKK